MGARDEIDIGSLFGAALCPFPGLLERRPPSESGSVPVSDRGCSAAPPPTHRPTRARHSVHVPLPLVRKPTRDQPPAAAGFPIADSLVLPGHSSDRARTESLAGVRVPGRIRPCARDGTMPSPCPARTQHHVHVQRLTPGSAWPSTQKGGAGVRVVSGIWSLARHSARSFRAGKEFFFQMSAMLRKECLEGSRRNHCSLREFA